MASSSGKDGRDTQVAVSTRKRLANGQEITAVVEKKANTNEITVQVNKIWFQQPVVNQTVDLTYDDSEIYQYESVDEKRTKTEAEFAELGIPSMTMIGPSSGTVLPKKGVYRFCEYDLTHIPIRLIDNIETLKNGEVAAVIEKHDVLTDYQNWYRYALTSLFPDTRVEPRVLETAYGAWAKICEWANEGCIQRNRRL